MRGGAGGCRSTASSYQRRKTRKARTKLRDWYAPVIVGATPLIEALAPQIAPRRAPVTLAAAMKGYRGWRRWIPKKGPKPEAPSHRRNAKRVGKRLISLPFSNLIEQEGAMA